METLQELNDRVNDLVSSIKDEGIDKKDFMSHKYMLISVHVHTERAKLDAAHMTNSQKLAIKRQLNLYCSLESIFKEKAHSYTTNEIHNVILEAQRLINLATNENT